MLGRHDGHHAFTVGQRRGIGVSSPEPLYVLSKDARRNRVVVGPRAALATRRAEVAPAVLHRDADRASSRAAALPRRGSPVRGRRRSGGRRRTRGSASRWAARWPAPAPGQTACLLDGELVVGWGTVAGADG